MIFGNVHHEPQLSAYPKGIQTALKFLAETDFLAMEPGVHPIDGEQIFAQVIDCTTEPRSAKRPEVHRKYVDVQFIVTGKERIAFYPDEGDHEVDEELLSTRDIIFYKNNPNAKEQSVLMEPGNFAVFFPWDVHIPSISIDGECAVRKIVVKVSMDCII